MVTERDWELWQCCSDTMSPEGLSTLKNMFAQVRLQTEEVFYVYLVKFAI